VRLHTSSRGINGWHMIITSVRMKALPEKRAELVQTLLAWLGVARKEPGCIAYWLCQDLEDQSSLWLVGEWKTQSDLDRHFRSSSFAVLQGARSLLREAQEITLHAVAFTAGNEAVDAARRLTSQRGCIGDR
jgi:quinol monooxygenase YgiN